MAAAGFKTSGAINHQPSFLRLSGRLMLWHGDILFFGMPKSYKGDVHIDSRRYGDFVQLRAGFVQFTCWPLTGCFLHA